MDPSSVRYIDSIGAGVGLHPDFGSGLYNGAPIGIPYVGVPASQPGVAVSFLYDTESDPGPYPIPRNAPIEGGPDGDGDRHVLVLERDTCKLYEVFNSFPQADGSWKGDSGAIFDLKSNALRPDGWTSADAAGMAVLPGLVRYDEVAAGEIRHALRFTVSESQRAYVWPARHRASKLTGLQYPPMGERFRLKANFDISGFSPPVQVILRALQKYGMMLADNGGNWFISGLPDERWNNDVLRQLRQVQGSEFEAVDVSSLQVDPDSGQARMTTRAAIIYLPLLAGSSALGPPIATPTLAPAITLTPGRSPTASRTPTRMPAFTQTPTDPPAATSTPTRMPTDPPAATPTPTRTPSITWTPTSPPAATPTPARTIVPANLFVDDDNATGVQNGSARNPYTTVQQAIDAASAGAVIAVAKGTYAENISVQNKTVGLYGGYVGGTASDYAGGTGGNFTVRDPAANPSHLQGNGMDSVVNMVEPGTSILDGFRITGGSRSTVVLPLCLGGGLYVYQGSPTISNNVIENNNTCPDVDAGQEKVGGGIYATGSNIAILDNLIRNNTSGRGAGIAANGPEVVIRGNTVQGNIGLSDHGGGLYIYSPKGEISYNRIVGNEIGRALGYGWGGGITVFNEGNSITFSHNVFTANYAPSVGSAIFVDDGAHAVLDHELIYANACNPAGNGSVPAIYVDGSAEGLISVLSMNHTTIAGHTCAPTVPGNAITVQENSKVTILNSILWLNGGDDVDADATSQVAVKYTLAQETLAGIGNLSTDPLFANPAGNDYHVRSTAGRWDPAANSGAGAWVLDGQDSPAIDAGDPASPFAAEPEPNGGRANMGADGNTPHASKSAP